MAATDADHHTWDLSDLFSGPADPDIEEALAGIIAKSERFRETFGDTLHTSGLSVDKLLEALGLATSPVLGQRPQQRRQRQVRTAAELDEAVGRL